MINSWTCSCKPFISVLQSQWYVNASFWPMQKVIRIIYFISLLKVIQKNCIGMQRTCNTKGKNYPTHDDRSDQNTIMNFNFSFGWKLQIVYYFFAKLINRKGEKVSKNLKKVSLTIFCKKRSSAHPFMVINLYRNHLLHSIRYFKK